MSATRAPDFRLSSVFRDHPKIAKLERLLGADGVLAWVQLLAYTSMQRPDGRLTKMDPEDIAIAARWKGDAATFLDALADLKLIDRREKNSRQIAQLVQAQWVRSGVQPTIEPCAKSCQSPLREFSEIPSIDARAMPRTLRRTIATRIEIDSPITIRIRITSRRRSRIRKNHSRRRARLSIFSIGSIKNFSPHIPAAHHEQLKSARAFCESTNRYAAGERSILASLNFGRPVPDGSKTAANGSRASAIFSATAFT